MTFGDAQKIEKWGPTSESNHWEMRVSRVLGCCGGLGGYNTTTHELVIQVAYGKFPLRAGIQKCLGCSIIPQGKAQNSL